MGGYRRLDVNEVGDVTVVRFRDRKIIEDQVLFKIPKVVRRRCGQSSGSLKITQHMDQGITNTHLVPDHVI